MRKPQKTETSRIGRRGTVVIPARLRKRFGMEEGELIIVEERGDGILLRPAVTLPVEIYTQERIAEFLLSNSIGEEEYQEVREEVRQMGLDPDAIPHFRPGQD